jgi:hypothetical protein
MRLGIEENIEEMLDYNVVNQYLDYKLVMLDYNVVMIVMDYIEVMLVKGMMYNQIDCLMVYKPVNLVNIVVMLENIEVMLVNMLVTLVNRLVMHYFHHDHLENMLVMLDLKIDF